MTKPRKTIEVPKVRRWANAALKNTGPEDQKDRKAIAWLLEKVLFETGNYNGFHYIDEDGERVKYEDIISKNYDQTRRCYHAGE